MPASKNYPWGEVRMAIISGFMTQREASEAYEIPLGTIAAECARKGWLRKPKAAPEVTEPVYPTYQYDPAKSEKIALETAASMKEELKNLGAKVARKGLRALADDKVPGEMIVAGSKNLKDLVDVAAKVAGFDTPDSQVILNMGFLTDTEEPERVIELPS